MAERLGNLGYVAIKPEATPGTPVIPTLYVPVYAEELLTEANLVEDNPVIGQKFKRYQVLEGLRAHKGSVTVMAEPNTAGHWLNMLMTKGTTTGAGPYTHPYTFSGTTDPKSYTLDHSNGAQVIRFSGVRASEISPEFEENEMRFNLSISALRTFAGCEIVSVSGTGPTTVNLDTTFDSSPTDMLKVGDLVQFWDVSAVAYVNGTVASIVDADTFTVTENWTAATAGDFVTLRPASAPSYALLTPFLWSKTEFRFGATAAAALSAAQTRLEQDSAWKIMHEFEDEDGAKRSGSKDPAALVYLQADAEFNIKKYFDNPLDMLAFQGLDKSACVIRHFSGDTNQYELRVTLNHLKMRSSPKPKLVTEEILYSEVEFAPQYDTSDTQAVDVKVLNNLSTIA